MIENWDKYKNLEYYPDRVCKCGCGDRIRVKSWHKYYGIPEYIHNHHTKGKIFPERSGENSPTKRLEVRAKMRASAHRGEDNSAKRLEVRKKISNSNKGHPGWNEGLTKETDPRVAAQAEKLSGRKKTLDHNRKNSEGLKKYYQGHPGVKTGENNPNWMGGIGTSPYPPEFNEELKEQVCERDNHTCQLCGRTEEDSLKQWEERLGIHHIDYIKENIDPTNLVTLCRSCNSKVNFNREYWKRFFGEVMKTKVKLEEFISTL